MDQNLIDKNQSQEEPQQNPPYIPNINSSNSNTSFNSTQNIHPQEELYYSSQTTNNDQQYPSQTYPVQPYPTQNMAIPPNQSYYPPQGATPIQPGAQMNNFSLQPGVLNYQPNPQNQNNKSYSSVEHKGIFQTEPNTFYITTGRCRKITPYILFFISLLSIVYTAFHLPQKLPAFIIGIIFFICILTLSCITFHSVFIILGPNTLTVISKSACYKKSKIYNPGELERIDFTCNKEKDLFLDKRKKGGYSFKNRYLLNIVAKSGYLVNALNVPSGSILFTSDGMEYFLNVVNTHIQTKMRV